ncbi:MAG: hypothetical protein M1837_006299 [Sclerophora amabilis]|nr:MAG: hypothetical protein M1837_006299 [Sclerophora amabilis]
MASNVEDAAALINHAFNCSSGGHGPAAPSDESWLSIEGVKCFQSWMSYSRLALTGLASVEPLKYLTPIAVQYLTYDDMFDSTSDLFFDILSNYPNFLRPGDMQMLLSLFISDWAHVRLQGLQQGDFEFESLQFGRLLLAFGDATMEDLLRSPESPDSQQVLGMLHGLLGCKGYPIAEDEICSQALEFWIAFVDLIGDSQYDAGQDETKWLAHAHNHITQAIEECWPKLKVPPQSISTTWDSETKKGFKNFRIDVGDLLLSSYRLIGTSICDTIVRAVLSAVEERNWIDVEAALFALKALSDSIGEGDHEDKMLARLFGSSLFPSLSRSETSVPSKTRQTAISVLGQYSLFFERRTEYLPAVLSFLFKALETPMLATAASRSIFTLCSFCRDSLKFDIDTFLVQYDTLLTSRTAETLVKERILGAIAAMVQAIPTDYEKLEPLRKLLVFVQRDVDACLVHLDGGFQLEGEEYGVASLRCLTSIGKGMQELGDTVIDLDSTQAPSLFWTDGPGASIREEVVKMVENITEVVGGNGEIIEAACNVFRAGLTESSPGPFVFPPVVLTSFVLKSTPSTPRLGLVLTTACVLISSHSAHSSSRIDKEASHILSHVFRLICNAGDHDPEVAQNCIDFMIKLLPRYLNVLLNFEPDIAMKQLLTFTLTCLTGRDVLPKRSAANFWATFVVLKDQEATLQITLDTTILSLGPELAHILIFNVGGNAARSELDIISEPLKKMVFRQPRSRMWLEKALFSRDFPSDKVAAPEKRRFLQKIMKYVFSSVVLLSPFQSRVGWTKAYKCIV